MIVIDASVLVTALVNDGPDGRSVRGRLQGVELAAPAHLDVEFLHALRGLVRSEQISPGRADRAIAHLVRTPYGVSNYLRSHPALGNCGTI